MYELPIDLAKEKWLKAVSMYVEKCAKEMQVDLCHKPQHKLRDWRREVVYLKRQAG